jgi:phosphatidyl-myo-inositol alpha-mannosyltransferase
VHFLGLVSDETKAAMLRSVDVFVAPNTGGESFGIVLLEAMAAGTPVLASDLESFRPVLDDGNAGELFRPEDPADLAAHALRLLGDRARRSEVASAADKVVDRYDWERVAHRVVAVYEAVTWNGLKVREDNRGQLFGRFTRLRDDSS